MFPGPVGTDPAERALQRLEAAVDRLAAAAARPRPGGGVPPEAVRGLADRLDEVVARLRAALGDERLRAALGDERFREMLGEDG